MMSESILRPGAGESVWSRVREGLPEARIGALVALVGITIPGLLLHFPMLSIIAGVVGLLGLTLVVACPFAGLLIFLGLLYLRPEEVFPSLAGARMTLLVSLVALIAWAINAFLCREEFLFHLPTFRCFLGFLAVAVVSTAAAGALDQVTLDLLKLLVLFVLIAHLVNTEARLRAATSAIVLFTALLGARTIWEYQHGVALIRNDGGARAMATGIFGDPNYLALGMAMALPLALGTVCARRGAWTRLWNLAASGVMLW